MQRRRQRLARRQRTEVALLAAELRQECNDCYKNSRLCSANEERFSCDDNCEECSFFRPHCDPCWHCPGCLDPAEVARNRNHGNPDRRVSFTV